MNPEGGGFAAAVLAAERRARLRGRPSGLKGRCRDRGATGLRPALDPGASTAPHRAGARAGAEPLPAGARGARLISRSNPYKQSLYGFRGLPHSQRPPIGLLDSVACAGFGGKNRARGGR
jgi:hypothetical protein